MAATGFSQKAPATISIDSIDKLYVTDAETALEHIGILRKECETTGWTQCSKDHLEAVESLIHLRQGDHHNAQKHAYAALAAPQEEDKTWRLIAYQTLCESFHATGNYALLGKYAMMMNLEADQPTFSALAHIYEAQALGRTGAFRQALAKADTATTIMENSMPQSRNEQFNALLLYYLSLDTKIQVCREAGMQEEAYAYAQQYLHRLEQEERKGYRDMDENGFKTERLALFLQLANICVALGKDGSQWFNEGMALCQELEHPAEITSEAADYLFRSGAPTTMIGLDVTLQTLLTYKETQQWRDLGTKAGKFLADMTDFYIKAYETTSPHLGGCGLHDPLAVGVAVDPTLVTTLDINMKVDVEGPTRGRTIGDETRLNDPVKTMKVAVGVDVPRFLNEFMTRISGLAAKAE